MPFAVASGNWAGRLVSLSAFTYVGLQYRLSLGETSWELTDLERLLLWSPFVLGILLFAWQQQGRDRSPVLKHLWS
jgi:hypothetical protein